MDRYQTLRDRAATDLQAMKTEPRAERREFLGGQATMLWLQASGLERAEPLRPWHPGTKERVRGNPGSLVCTARSSGSDLSREKGRIAIVLGSWIHRW